MSDAEARAAGELAERIKPLLAGKGAEVQGAALADLLAIWIAGHRVVGDPKAQDELRAELLAAHIKAVCELIELADLEIDEKLASRRRRQ